MVEIPEVLTDPQRHGVLTTEFWITLLGLILAALVKVHFVTPDDGHFLAQQITAAVPLVFQLVVIGGLVYHYIRSRTAVKLTPPPWTPHVVGVSTEQLRQMIGGEQTSPPQAPSDQSFENN